ncbi:Predicted transcriptional regulator [Saccharopolyspora antimicrobica]|uniref:Transcriptional regulator n=2 Tax=Saccharopolyspora TaxID=1835 RepID=A0A1I5LYT1_9PSEU|nr:MULTISPECIES: BlaI/MecI/CopY family transcriptional regulator [Saccharopolyspora]RKT89051.1 putative transcriptional regulator [Saccharopolyspora antimicrobica]SEG45424.1 Predicted transcriptional regulator [Saccharopolyspora kobensis]SFE52944.1 Predicted transcriptional regulator [Saccharopolyspora kobensis]SFP01926.1 Predicted transcriptional regulator [Saccharopolyspora antimicrobica]
MRSLGPLESAVMDHLWSAGDPLSVREVLDGLRDRGLAYTTVATVLENLHRKQWVDRDRVGRVWFYRPRLQASEHAALLMREALAASNSPRATFLRFVDEITEEEAAMLRELLAEAPEDR